MKYYKGFKPDMTCRRFQYKEGESYETDTAKLCSAGFHACEAPLEVFRYYAPYNDDGKRNKFHEVELDQISNEKDSDTKVVAKKIKIGAELNFSGLAKAHVEWVKNNIEKKIDGEGNCSAATNTGENSAATNTGNCSVATNTGEHSVATNTGNYSVAVAWGVFGKAKASKGSYIVLAEWAEKNGDWEFKGAKMAEVDGKKIKADTFYRLVDGEFVEVEE